MHVININITQLFISKDYSSSLVIEMWAWPGCPKIEITCTTISFDIYTINLASLYMCIS